MTTRTIPGSGWEETSILYALCQKSGITLGQGRRFLRELMARPFDERRSLLEMSTPREATEAANGAEALVSASFAAAYRERSAMARKHGDLTLAQELADTADGYAAEAAKLGWRP